MIRDGGEATRVDQGESGDAEAQLARLCENWNYPPAFAAAADQSRKPRKPVTSNQNFCRMIGMANGGTSAQDKLSTAL